MFESTIARDEDLSVSFSGPRQRTVTPAAIGPDVFAARSPAGRRDPMSAFELASRGTRLDLGA